MKQINKISTFQDFCSNTRCITWSCCPTLHRSSKSLPGYWIPFVWISNYLRNFKFLMEFITEIEEHTTEAIWFRQVLINHLLHVFPLFLLYCFSSSHIAWKTYFSKKSLTKIDKRFHLKNKIIYELSENKNLDGKGNQKAHSPKAQEKPQQ